MVFILGYGPPSLNMVFHETRLGAEVLANVSLIWCCMTLVSQFSFNPTGELCFCGLLWFVFYMYSPAFTQKPMVNTQLRILETPFRSPSFLWLCLDAPLVGDQVTFSSDQQDYHNLCRLHLFGPQQNMPPC